MDERDLFRTTSLVYVCIYVITLSLVFIHYIQKFFILEMALKCLALLR